MRSLLSTTLGLIFLFCASSFSHAAPQHLFKIGSLAPPGSVWIAQFEKFGAEVEEKTGGAVSFRTYPGGVMGDDQAMYRKMRVGQLHGGGFTMTGISAVVPDFRVMSIPFLYKTYEEVDHVREGLFPAFVKRFEDKGLALIALTEVGFIYAMSTKPIATFTDLQQSVNWSPSGDPVAEQFLAALDITPVQLSIPDVLSSLQSGLVETVYNSLYGSIVLQWFSKAKYIVDQPYGYAYGAFALDGKKYKSLPAEYREIIQKAAATHFAVLLDQTRQSNMESKGVLEQQGCRFLPVDGKTIETLQARRDLAVKKLVPAYLSQDIYDRAVALQKAFQVK
jgi:TRAP-type C4-dicarboxylate transport system substrate-binding protein